MDPDQSNLEIWLLMGFLLLFFAVFFLLRRIFIRIVEKEYQDRIEADKLMNGRYYWKDY